MKIKNLERVESGDVAFNVECSTDEVQLLVNFALNALMAAGLVPEQEGDFDLLNSLNDDSFYQA